MFFLAQAQPDLYSQEQMSVLKQNVKAVDK